MMNKNIQITKIVQSETGYVVAAYCPICKATVFANDSWIIKPKDGDFFFFKEMCFHETLAHPHNMMITMNGLKYSGGDLVKLPWWE